LHFPCGTVFNRVNEFNPQIYAKCQKMMRVVVFIEDPAMIRKIVQTPEFMEPETTVQICHARLAESSIPDKRRTSGTSSR